MLKDTIMQSKNLTSVHRGYITSFAGPEGEKDGEYYAETRKRDGRSGLV